MVNVELPKIAAFCCLAIWSVISLGPTPLVQAQDEPAAPAAAAASQLAPGTDAAVTLHPKSRVDGTTVTLGEIATIRAAEPSLKERLAALPVGRAPVPGDERRVTTGLLELRMRQANLTAERIVVSAPEGGAVVTTRSQTVTAAEIGLAVRNWLDGRLKRPAGVELNVDVEAEDVVVSGGHVSLKVATETAGWERMTLPVEVRVEGRPVRRLNARVTTSVRQRALVLTHSLHRGRTVTPADVVEREVTLSAPVSASVKVGEVRTRRYIREGTVLTGELVEAIPDSERGDRVRIVAEFGQITVEAPGILEADGFVGDLVSVTNAASGRTVQGRLVAEDRVEVEVW